MSGLVTKLIAVFCYLLFASGALAANLTLGINDTVQNVIVDGNLIVPLGATGCTIDSVTVYGQCDIGESVTIKNTICFNPAGDGIDIDAGKTVTADHVAYDTQVGAGTFTCAGADCISGISDPFHDAVGENFRLHRTNGAALKDQGATTLTDDLDGLTRPRGTDDIGTYERQWSGDIVIGATVISNPSMVNGLGVGDIYEVLGLTSTSAP